MRGEGGTEGGGEGRRERGRERGRESGRERRRERVRDVGGKNGIAVVLPCYSSGKQWSIYVRAPPALS